jgi:hypothetical protein
MINPTGQFARRFPLVARPRPACTPLARRVADLCDRARDAERNIDTATASAVHNLAALLASDCGLPELARQWCHRQANAYLRACPLDAQAARHALEPLVNLARLHIRDGHGERAFDLIEALYTNVSTRTEATIDGVEVPAHLTNSEETHHEVRRWLWTVLLATGARALAIAGRWQEACTRLRNYKGIGRRMLDGRQVAVIANATSGNSKAALALLDETEPGEPWENAVTACLTIQCRSGVGTTDTLLNRYYALNAAAPGLAVFHIRLGLSFIDAIGTLDNPHTRRIATSLINRAIAAQDGYAAQDVLAHSSLHGLLSSTRAQELVNLVEACALGCGILPEKLLADITIALASAEEVITRAAIPPPQLLVRHPTGQARKIEQPRKGPQRPRAGS